MPPRSPFSRSRRSNTRFHVTYTSSAVRTWKSPAPRFQSTWV